MTPQPPEVPAPPHSAATPADTADVANTDPSPLHLSPHITVDDAGKRRLIDFVRCCDHTLEVLQQWGQHAHWIEPGPASPRHFDTAAVTRKTGPGGVWTPDSIDIAVQTSVIYVAAAGQHLAGIRGLLATGNVIFPVAPLVRAIVELCARVTWTLAPNTDLDVRDRVARMVLIELDDVDRARILANDFGQRDLGRKHAQRLADLRKQRLEALFFPSERSTDDRGRHTVRGQKLPSLTASVKTLKTPGLYAGLSAASHPTRQLVVELIDKSRLAARAAAAVDPLASVPLSFRLPDMQYLAILVRNAALSIVQAWTLLATYGGNDRDALDTLQDIIAELTRDNDTRTS